MICRFLAALLVVLVFAHPAGAQETYQLDGGEWDRVAAPGPGTPEAALQDIRKLLAQGQAREARERATEWMREHPNHPLIVEARLLRGDARVAMGDYYKALYDYEFIARSFTASEQWLTALQREFEIARLFVEGMNRKFLGFRLLPAKGEGEELLIRIQERVPGSELGEKASMMLANYYFDDGDMYLASEAYDLFLMNYPRSPQREWAMLRLIQANLARFAGPAFDPTGLIEAAQRLRAYQAEFPAAAQRIGAEALMIRIRASLAEKELVDAMWYDQRGEEISAAYLYRRLIETHPQTPAAQEAITRLARLPVPVVQKTAAIPLTPEGARVDWETGEQTPPDVRRARDREPYPETVESMMGPTDPYHGRDDLDEPSAPEME
jgi:outer membrane assembly lipoprotein YfiO